MTPIPAPLPALPEPLDWCYEWDGPYGTRKFGPSDHFGRKYDRAVALFNSDQMRAYARAAIAAQPAPDPALLTAVRLVLDCHQEQLPMALDALRDIAGDAPVAQQAAQPQKPDGRLHADGYFTWHRRDGYALDRRLPCDFYLAPPAAHAQQPALALTDAQDAARWRWLRERLLAGDFDYGGDGTQALVFEMPQGFTVSADADFVIDVAMRLAGIPAPTTDTGEQS